MADELKKAGNAALQAGNFRDAISNYTEAISLDGNSHVLYSNRSAAYCSSQMYSEAEADGRKCVAIKPDFAKGYSRIGAACVGQLRYDDAEAAYREGLKVDPENAGIKDGLRDVEAARRDASSGGGAMNAISGMFGPQLIPKIAASPQHSHLLKDADFMQKLQQVQTDPNSLSAHFQDPRFLSVLELALGARVRMPGQGDDEANPYSSAPPPAPKKKEEAPPVSEERQKAVALKDEGNVAYKAKDFPLAIEKYEAALTADPTYLQPHTNLLSVYIEQKEYEKVLTEADGFIAKAREARPSPFDLIAKAMTRKGTATERMGDLKGAISIYKSAMIEQRSADTLGKLKDAEKALKKQEEESYYDKEKAAAAKKEANDCFREHVYPKAVELYTESIKRDPTDHSTYTNRAAAYMKLFALDQALKDCDQALKMKPDFVRAMTRKARVYLQQKDAMKAMEWFERALKEDPGNRDAIEGKNETIQAIQQMGGASDEEHQERLQRAMQDPEIAQILSDPMMRIVLDTLSTDPTKGQDYMKDPDICAKLNKLIAAGVVSTKAA